MLRGSEEGREGKGGVGEEEEGKGAVLKPVRACVLQRVRPLHHLSCSPSLYLPPPFPLRVLRVSLA